MAKLDEITLVIESEQYGHSIEATQYPVESGESLTDHIEQQPSDFSISGKLLSKTWNNDLEKLKQKMNTGKLVKFVGKQKIDNVIILSIGEDHNKDIANGFAINIKLRRIRVSKSSYQAPKVKPPQKPKVQPKTTSGKKQPTGTKKTTAVYHTIKKGDTYYIVAKKYGTTVANLMKLNKYDPKKLPIGGKILIRK